MGTSLVRNNHVIGPCSRTVPRALWWSYAGARFLVSEVSLYCYGNLNGASRVDGFHHFDDQRPDGSPRGGGQFLMSEVPLYGKLVVAL